MDTINNLANSASKAIWGENKETAEAAKTGEEPTSGSTGNVAAGEPYDAGNLDSTNTEKTVPKVDTNDPPTEVLASTHITPLKPAVETTAEEDKAEEVGTSTNKPVTSATTTTSTGVTAPKEGDGSHTAATNTSPPAAPLTSQAATETETSGAGKEGGVTSATTGEPSLTARAPTEHESGPAADPAPIDAPRKSTTTTGTNESGSDEKGPGKLDKVKDKAKEGMQKMKSKLSKDKSTSDKSS